MYNQVIDKYGDGLPVTGRRRSRVRHEPQQSEPTQAPRPEQPRIIEDDDQIKKNL